MLNIWYPKYFLVCKNYLQINVPVYEYSAFIIRSMRVCYTEASVDIVTSWAEQNRKT